MSNIIDTGLQWFPMSYAGSEAYTYPSQQGMTLRDWFAGQALVSMGVEYTDDKFCHASVSKCAYAYADAMLRAREVKP